ncbi:MAG: carboxy terminal-processing peptidase [Cellvibrionaceae bacterium]|nr:carboxy terminal-processing peptidase [Cellvibrionaceae bacterium]
MMPVYRRLTICLCLIAAAVLVAVLNPLQAKTDQHGRITLEIIETLEAKHFAELTLDDRLSEQLLNNYLDKLDANKTFFFQADIDEFMQYRTLLDDQLLKGDNSSGFLIYYRFKQRFEERIDKVIALLKDDALIFDFSTEDVLTNDEDRSQWLSSAAAADALWRKRIKSVLLAQKLAGEDLHKARDQLLKRYENQKLRVQKNTDNDIYELYINAFTQLYDPHTTYLSPRTAENFTINMSLSLEGIGAVLQTEDEHTKVVRLISGGPAIKQGELKPADIITGVGQGETGDITDVVGWQLDEVVDKIRGPKGSLVRLQVRPADPVDTGKVISIRRDKVKLEDQAAQKAILPIQDQGQAFKFGVINIPNFYLDFQALRQRDPNYRSTSRDVQRLLYELLQEGIDGLIIDLRNNGGGSLQEANSLTDLFIEKGPIVQIGNGDNNYVYDSKTHAQYRGPLIVMINRLSASASEIFAGAIQDYSRGLIVGSQSFGKGTVQGLHPLNNPGDLKITESKFYRVSGESTQHRGVVPDILFPESVDIDKVGESSYKTALPWSVTDPVKHQQYIPIHKFIAPLNQQHQARITSNPDFIYMKELKALLAGYSDAETISLNEKIRIQEQQAFEEQSLSIENKRRKAKGEPVYASYSLLKEDNKKQNEARDVVAGTTVIDLDNDALLKETGYILSDYISLLAEETQKNATAAR